MLFKKQVLEKIKNGEITVAFRRWSKAAVKAGGTLRTSVGVLQFKEVKILSERNLKLRDAKAAGYATLQDLLADLRTHRNGRIYQIRLKWIGDDPRIKLRSKANVKSVPFQELLAQVSAMDRRSKRGPWIQTFLEILMKYPGVPSRELAPRVGLKETIQFKTQVRRLKNLGLTISLGTGYKLSPRGRALLKEMRDK